VDEKVPLGAMRGWVGPELPGDEVLRDQSHAADPSTPSFAGSRRGRHLA
jgi:hypothetical protein